MLKYNAYKKLTPEQKEEYNFKFVNKQPKLGFKGVATYIIIVFLAFTIVLLMGYLVTNDAVMQEIFDTTQISELVLSFTKLASAFYILLTIYISIYVIEMIIYYVRLSRFMKRCGVIKRWFWQKKE